MSVTIQISFENDLELLAIAGRLSDLNLHMSNRIYTSGSKYSRVYFKGTTELIDPDGRPQQKPRKVPQRKPLEAE